MQVREYSTQGATFRIRDAQTLGIEIAQGKFDAAVQKIEGPLTGVARDVYIVILTCVVYTVDIVFDSDALTDDTRSLRDVWTSEAFKARDYAAMWGVLCDELTSEARDVWFEAWQRTRPTNTAPDELTPEAEAAVKAGEGDADFLADGTPKASGTSKPSASTRKR